MTWNQQKQTRHPEKAKTTSNKVKNLKKTKRNLSDTDPCKKHLETTDDKWSELENNLEQPTNWLKQVRTVSKSTQKNIPGHLPNAVETCRQDTTINMQLCTHHAPFPHVRRVRGSRRFRPRIFVCLAESPSLSVQHDSFAPVPVFPAHHSVGTNSRHDPPHEVPLRGPHQRDWLVRLAESSPFTGCEANDFIEQNLLGRADNIPRQLCLFCFKRKFLWRKMQLLLLSPRSTMRRS